MVLKEGPTDTMFAGVKEIRECRLRDANQLLKEGWELASIMPIAAFVTENREKGIGPHVRKGIAYVMVSRHEHDHQTDSLDL